MSERVDAVVIGGGLGGLAAAVTMAGEGRQVVVLEQHSEAGGYASSFQRGPYRFDTALHALNGLAPGGGMDELYKRLGLWDRLRLHRLDPLYVLRGPGHEVVAHADPFWYEAELVRSFPDQSGGIRAYLDEALAVYRDARRLQVAEEAGQRISLEDLPRDYPALVRVSGETWDQMMGRHVSDPLTRTALGALWGYVGVPPSQCAATVGAIMAMSYQEHGGWYPEGGAQAISGALVQRLRQGGGEIRYGQLVTALDFAGEHVVAARTREGLRLEAELFVANASAPATMLELVGAQRLPAEYVERVGRPTREFTTFSVYLGLTRDLFAEHGLAHELFLDPWLDADSAWRASQDGDWSRTALGLTDYTRVDPGCAPPGHAAVVLSTVASWDYENVWGTGGNLDNYHQNPRYLELKEKVTDALVRRATDALPGLMEAIDQREASTPLTNFHYTRNPRGAIEGYDNTLQSTRLGPLSPETPVGNLFLAGAWAGGGGMQAAMTSGVSAGRRALAKQAHAATHG